MAITETSIIKNALRLLGEPDTEGADDDSTWVVRLKSCIAETTRNMFEDHDWNFATSVQQLANVTPAETGWDYTFSEPSGSFRIIRVSNTTVGVSNRSQGSIAYEQRSGKILTNFETTYCSFIDAAKQTMYGAWPQKVADYLAALIAEQVYPVTDKRDTTAQRIDRAVKRRGQDARQFDARSQPAPPRHPGTWHGSRNRGVGGARWR